LTIVAHLPRHGPSIYLFDPEGNPVELKGPTDGKPHPD
jgi:hypothetical protein